jgi:hypothetical protein
MCPPTCNSGVHVRVWVVRRDVPVSLVPRIVGSDPDSEKDGNRLVGAYPVSFFFGLSWGMHSSVCLGSPFKVFNQSIIGFSLLSETA